MSEEEVAQQTAESTEQVSDEKPEAAQEPESDDEEVEYVCPPEFDDRLEMKKMFVGGIDKDTTDEEFKELFEPFGEVIDHVIIRANNNSNRKKSDRLFGFITFGKCDDLEECLLKRPHKYKEKELDVKRAVPKGQEDDVGHQKVKKLHVANIPADMKEKELLKYLKKRHPKKYGEFTGVNILKSKDESGNEKNRGFGFLDVSSEDFADRVSIGESKFTLNGNNYRISKAKPKNADGSRRGGFRGGKQQYGGGYGGDWGQGYAGGDWGYGYGPYGYDPTYNPYASYGYPPAPTRGRGNRYAPY